jgi:hypothetical protein
MSDGHSKSGFGGRQEESGDGGGAKTALYREDSKDSKGVEEMRLTATARRHDGPRRKFKWLLPRRRDGLEGPGREECMATYFSLSFFEVF